MKENKNSKKTASKSLIFLKASTVAMGIVLLVLLLALILGIKQKKIDKKNVANCQNILQIETAGEVEKMEVQGAYITILTKPNSKNKAQEIIKIDSNSLKIISKIKLQPKLK